MNILIVNCSPVKNGATAEIVNLVSTYTKINNNKEVYYGSQLQQIMETFNR